MTHIEITALCTKKYEIHLSNYIKETLLKSLPSASSYHVIHIMGLFEVAGKSINHITVNYNCIACNCVYFLQ